MQWLNPLNIGFVAIVALVVLGPERLPGTLRTMGRYWGEIQRLRTQAESQMRDVIGDLGIPSSTNPTTLARNYLQGFSVNGSETQGSATTSVSSPSVADTRWSSTAITGQREVPARRAWSAPGRLVPYAPELEPGFDDPICN